jgi:D-3-phosphoglycerate dehydrogenase
MPGPQILVIDSFDAAFRTACTRLPAQIHWADKLTRAEILPLLTNIHILVLKSKTVIDAEFISYAPHLKAVIRAGSGIEHIDSYLLNQKGILLLHTPEGNCDAVGEQAVGMLLMLLNHLRRADTEVRNKIWEREKNRGNEIGGKVVGIIGYGHTGGAFAKKLSGFGAEVIGYDKYKINYTDPFIRETTIEEIFERAHILSLHVPLTEETFHLVNAAFLARFRLPIWLLNLSRGAVVETDALISALRAGKIRGAALDVFENEHFDTLTPQQSLQLDALAASENVVLSPHIGGLSVESARRINQLVIAKIQVCLDKLHF